MHIKKDKAVDKVEAEPDADADADAKVLRTKALISRQLETIVAESVHALNTGQDDTSLPPWSSFSKHFRNEPNGPAPNLSTVSEHPHLSNSDVQNLAGVLAYFRTLRENSLEFTTRLIEVTTTHLDLEEGFATVMMRCESYGVPNGVVRPSVSAFEFRREKREWRAVRQRTLPGLEYAFG